MLGTATLSPKAGRRSSSGADAAKYVWRLTVIRPGFLWSPNNPWIAGTGHSFGRWHLIFGIGRALPITYVQNCAECIAIAVDHPAAVGETFNVVDDERITAWGYMGQALRGTGTDGRRICVPYCVGMATANVASWCGRVVFGKSAKLPGLLVPIRYRARFRPLRFTSQKAQTQLGWRPRWTFAEAWQRVDELEPKLQPAVTASPVSAVECEGERD